MTIIMFQTSAYLEGVFRRLSANGNVLKQFVISLPRSKRVISISLLTTWAAFLFLSTQISTHISTLYWNTYCYTYWTHSLLIDLLPT